MYVPLTIADFLRRGAFAYSQRVAVVDEPGVPGSLGAMTYQELESRAWGMAQALSDLGVGVGDRVAIVSPNAARFQIAFFGVSGFGRVLVPINYRLNADEIAYIVEHSGSSVLLVDPELADALSNIEVPHRFVLDGQDDASLFAPFGGSEAPAATAEWEPDESATASINYTSGTTARPKGVQLTHRNCWLNAVTFGWHAGVSDRDVFLHTLPMFHCNGWGMPYAMTGMGVRQVVQRKIDGEEILRRIEEQGVTALCGAPAVAAAILDAATRRRESGLEVPGRDQTRIVLAGAPPPSRTIERIETELGWEFLQIYGLTETSPLLTVNRAPGEWDELGGPQRSSLLSRAGTPALGVQMKVDEDGEILARSNHVFAGYWQQPTETANALEGGWFRTGDGGHFDGCYLVIADRKKDVIITGGENVSSIEVEDCLFQHPAVAEVAVIGVPDEKWGETVKALVVVRPGQETSEAELIVHCRQHLAHFKCPTSVDFCDELSRTATGKLQKFKIREPYWAGKTRRVG